MNIKLVINNERFKKLNNLIKYAVKNNEPIACLVKKGILINEIKNKSKKIISNTNPLNKIYF